jgi:C1A family cysteine protease
MITLPRKLGWIPDLPDRRDFVYKVSKPIAQPPRIDLPIRLVPCDQGQLGSCTANAIVKAVEYDRIKQGLTDFQSSRLFLYYNERAMRGWQDIDSGAFIRDGIKSMSNQGDCPEDEWPYVESKFADKPSDSCYVNALLFKALNYHRMTPTLYDMRGCLVNGVPFVFGFTVYDNFPWSGNGDVQMPTLENFSQGGHAVLCVGYDDTTKRFKFLNSWGLGWGRSGYGTIPYEYLTNPGLSHDFWVISTVQ